MSPNHRMDDEQLARLVGAVGADADPAVLARARARILAGGRRAADETPLPAGLAWLCRPAALTGAAAACALALVAGFWFGGSATTAEQGTALAASSSETLPGALLEDLDATEAVPGDEVAGDSGGPS